MNKAEARTIGSRVEKAARDELGDDYEVTMKSGSFSDSFVTIKLEVATLAEDGTARTKEREDFALYAKIFGLDPKMLDQSFTTQGKTYTITGLKPRSKKYPVLATDKNGKTFKFSASAVSRALK